MPIPSSPGFIYSNLKLGLSVHLNSSKPWLKFQHGSPIKVIKSYRGREFIPLTKFLIDLGIIHRVTCPHTHHQNGVVERKHRHIMDFSLTLLN